MSSKYMQILLVDSKVTIWRLPKSVFNCRFVARHVQFGMKIDHKYTCKFCIVRCLQTNHKRGDGAEL